MKKILSVILLFAMLLTFFAACGDNGEDGESKNEEQQQAQETEKPKDVKKTFTPDSVKPTVKQLREYCYAHMEKMSQIEWTTPQTIDLQEKITKGLIYEPGKTYTGMPYTYTNKEYEAFLSRVDDKGVYQGPYDINTAIGNTCSSSVTACWTRVDKNAKMINTPKMTPVLQDWIVPVGEYSYTSDDNATELIIARNKAEVIYEAYTHLEFADVVVAAGGDMWKETGHTRLVKENHVERTATGKVKPGNSYIVTLEQTNSFDKDAKKGVNTTWYVEHKYTYTDLYLKCYIPITLKSFTEEPAPLDAKVSDFPTAKTVTSGKLRGTIDSNYFIETVKLEIINAETDEVATSCEYSCLNYFFSFVDKPVPEGLGELAKGEYLCRISLKTSGGEGAIYGYYFNVK